MLVLGDDILLGRISVDLIDRPGLPVLFKRRLLVGIADGDIAGCATTRDRRLDGLLDIIELVFAAGTGIVLTLAIGVSAGIEIDIGIDLIAPVFLRADEVGPGQRAGVQIDLAIAGDQAGCGKS